MTKEELGKYANENRKRLGAQKVKIGDVVKVLRGQFAGETGVVVGIITCGNDYTDPYYEVNMYCEVPDKYKCRKNTLAQPNNVIGGLSAYEFEVIGNRIPTQPTAPTIKVGDFVRVLENLHDPFCLDVERHLGITNIPPHAVSQKEWEVISVEVCRDCAGHIYTLKHDDSFIYNIPEDCVERVEPTEQTEAEKTDIDNIVDDFAKVMEGYRKVFADIADNFDWQRYEADLAKDIAVKIVNKKMDNDPTEAADYAVSVAKAVVENLKKK